MNNDLISRMTTPIEITCPNCKSVLEYTYLEPLSTRNFTHSSSLLKQQDIERREENNIFGLYAGVTRYIVCPVCKRDIDIRAKVEMKEAEND